MQAFVPIRSAGEISLSQPAVRNLWAAGTMLRATVVDTGLPGRVQLQIGHHAVEARTTLPLRGGETLNLRVSHSGELTVLEKGPPVASETRTASADARNAQIESALRQALPRQRSLGGLLANLQHVASRGAGAGLEPKLVDAARAFLAQFPGQREVREFRGLNELIARSGIAYEARAAASQPSQAPDLKSALLRLITQLLPQAGKAEARTMAPPSPPVAAASPPAGPAPAGAAFPATAAAPASPPQPAQSPRAAAESLPPLREGAVQAQPRVLPGIDLRADAGIQLLRQADAALARVQLSQLASVPLEDTGRQVWMFELGLRGSHETPDLVQFRIEQEAPRQHAGEPDTGTRWSVNIGLDLDELGAIEVRVSWFDDTVSASFRAEQSDTSTLINQRLSVLREALADRGLTVDCVACREGLPEKLLRLETKLIEERA